MKCGASRCNMSMTGWLPRLVRKVMCPTLNQARMISFTRAVVDYMSVASTHEVK